MKNMMLVQVHKNHTMCKYKNCNKIGNGEGKTNI